MPVYNGAKYLREAVESILMQSFGNFELIILDDGSIDDTKALLHEFSDPRICRLVHGENLGVSAARNHCLRMAQGELIAWMDADDISLPERLTLQRSYLRKNPELGLVGSQAIIIDGEGKETGRSDYASHPFLVDFLMPLAHPFCIAATMCRRELIEKAGSFQESFLVAEDYDLLLRLSDLCEIRQLEFPLYKCRVHSESLTGCRFSLQETTAAQFMSPRLSSCLNIPVSDELIFGMRQLLGIYWPGERPVSSFTIDMLLKLQENFLTRRHASGSDVRKLKRYIGRALINFAYHDHGPTGQYALQQATRLKIEIHSEGRSTADASSDAGKETRNASTRSDRSILIISEWDGETGNQNRYLLEILNQLPPSRRVILVGNSSTEEIRSLLTSGTTIQNLDLDFYTFPFLTQKEFAEAPRGEILAGYLETFFRVNLKALDVLREKVDPAGVDLVYSDSAGIILGALFAAQYEKPHLWRAPDKTTVVSEAARLWSRLMSELADELLPAQPMDPVASAGSFLRRIVGMGLDSSRRSALPADEFSRRLLRIGNVGSGSGIFGIFVRQVLDRQELIRLRDEELDSVKSVLRARDEELASIKPVLAARNEELQSIKEIISARDVEIDSLKFVLGARDAEPASIRRT